MHDTSAKKTFFGTSLSKACRGALEVGEICCLSVQAQAQTQVPVAEAPLVENPRDTPAVRQQDIEAELGNADAVEIVSLPPQAKYKETVRT